MKLHSTQNWSRTRRKAFKAHSRRTKPFANHPPLMGEGSRSGRRNAYTKDIAGKTKARIIHMSSR